MTTTLGVKFNNTNTEQLKKKKQRSLVDLVHQGRQVEQYLTQLYNQNARFASTIQ